MKKLLSLIALLMITISAMAYEITLNPRVQIGTWQDYTNETGTLTITPNGDNYDVTFVIHMYSDYRKGTISVSNVPMIDNKLTATSGISYTKGYGNDYTYAWSEMVLEFTTTATKVSFTGVMTDYNMATTINGTGAAIPELAGGEEEHVHSYATAWSYDENTHWHACTSTEGTCDTPKADEAAHTWDNRVCSVCGAVKTPKGETPEDALTLVIGDNNFSYLGSSDDPIWYKIDLVEGEYVMNSNNQFTGSFYSDPYGTALADISRSYNFTYDISSAGTYYFKYTQGWDNTVITVSNNPYVGPDGSEDHPYTLHLGENDLMNTNESQILFYQIDLTEGFYVFTPSENYSYQILDADKNKVAHYAEKPYSDQNPPIIIHKELAAGKYYVEIWQCSSNQKITIEKEIVWDDIAILGNFPNSGWDNPRVPLYLATKLETNKFCGTIDASNWQNTTYDFKLYNEENLGAETNYWGNNQTISFTNSNTANFHEGNDNANNHWVHNTTYKAYYVVAEYKYSVSDNSFYWDVNVTGIPAGVYFPGTWNDWVPADDNVKLDGSSYLTLTLEANTDYQFKIFDTNGCNWFGCEEAITADNTGNPRQFILTSGEDRTSDNCTIHTGLAGNYVFHITAWDNNQPSQPSLEVKYPSYAPKTLTLVAKDDDTYYATFSNDKDVIFASENANVRVVTAENLKLSMETVDMFNDAKNGYSGYSVPANTGILISSTSNSVTYYIVEGQTITPISKDNMLHPKSVGMNTLEGDYLFYKLAYGDWTNKTRLGFYWGNDNGGPFSIKDGTAYLAVPTNLAGQVKSFVFKDEETDGINSVNGNSAKDDHIYNLNGQRISMPTRGQLYIKNGKTYIGE